MADLAFREPGEKLVQFTFRKSLNLLCHLFDGTFHINLTISNFVPKINTFEIGSFLWSNDPNQSVLSAVTSIGYVRKNFVQCQGQTPILRPLEKDPLWLRLNFPGEASEQVKEDIPKSIPIEHFFKKPMAYLIRASSITPQPPPMSRYPPSIPVGMEGATELLFSHRHDPPRIFWVFLLGLHQKLFEVKRENIGLGILRILLSSRRRQAVYEMMIQANLGGNRRVYSGST
jgi:hypothetical protein